MRASQRGILGFLERLASSEPARPLLGSGRHWLDAGTVLAFVEHIGSYLRRLGFRQGDLAAFRPGRDVPSALMILGLRSAGVTVVLASEVIGGFGELLLTGGINATIQDFTIGWPGLLLQVIGTYLIIKYTK